MNTNGKSPTRITATQAAFANVVEALQEAIRREAAILADEVAEAANIEPSVFTEDEQANKLIAMVGNFISYHRPTIHQLSNDHADAFSHGSKQHDLR